MPIISRICGYCKFQNWYYKQLNFAPQKKVNERERAQNLKKMEKQIKHPVKK